MWIKIETTGPAVPRLCSCPSTAKWYLGRARNLLRMISMPNFKQYVIMVFYERMSLTLS